MARISATAATVMAGMTAALWSTMVRASEEVAGKPVPGGLNFQKPVTEVADRLQWFDNILLVVITLISIFVMVLLAIVIVRFRKERNPEPSRFTHNAVLEVVWTAVPIVILIAIAVPSLRLLWLQLEVPEPDVTIKATGNQWYWSYEYPDHDVTMDAFMLGAGKSTLDDEVRAELTEYGYQEDEFLLATDTRVVVPVNANVHVLVTGSDVIHAWAVPSFGVKIDAIPGRTNETWFRAEEEGTYFGQCSELCGKDHSYMPIVVEVVSQEAYDAWIAEQVALRDGVPTRLAQTGGQTAAE